MSDIMQGHDGLNTDAFKEGGLVNEINNVNVNKDNIREATTQDAELSLSTDFSMLLDINVTLSVELGNKIIKLKELLSLEKNSIVELNKATGKTLDIKANNTVIAKGEVVVVNGSYGIRLVELVGNVRKIGGM